MPRPDPQTLKRPAISPKKYVFTDPQQDIEIYLAPLDPPRFLEAQTFADNVIRLLLTGGGVFQGKFYANPLPFPAVDGKPVTLNADLIRMAVELEFMQYGPPREYGTELPDPYYTTERLLQLSPTLIIAFFQLQNTHDELMMLNAWMTDEQKKTALERSQKSEQSDTSGISQTPASSQDNPPQSESSTTPPA